MNKINLNSVSESCIKGFAFNARLLALMLLTLVLLVPLVAVADGLFDFQMKLAKGGNAEAQYKVGEMYETGFGVKQDQKEAMSWTTKAANQGHETAGFKLLYWDVEKNGLKGDNKAKVGELKNKADSGNPQAQYYIGKMHAYGVGMKKNSDKAVEWLNKAAFVGVLEAERELTTVRENQQLEAQARKARQEKKQAQLKAKQEREKQAKLEQQKKLKAKKDAEAKARADATAKQKKDKADALEKANQQKSYKVKQAEKKQAEAKQRKAREQALLKKKAEKKERKEQFESDPCSGKSAKFLSTCR